jgi:glucose/arabinose dehydrogenase
MSAPFPSRRFSLAVVALLAGFALLGFGDSRGNASPFAIQGPGVNSNNFRVTVFASGLSFPLGMVQLSDGSLLVAVTQVSNYFSTSTAGQLLRFTDTNQDGVADGPGTVLYSGLPGGLTSLRMCGNLFFVTGQGPGHPITVLRAGATPASPLSLVGAININYPSGAAWEHSHSALGIRPTPGQPGSCDLLFQLGSDQNFAATTRTATISSTQITGATGTLQGQSIYLLTLTDNLRNVTASNLTRLAQGLRNPAGFAFHPVTGDLYFEDNGIDGLTNGNEPLSVDRVNFIPAAQIGNGTVPDFGYPTNYTEYRTGRQVGSGAIPPLFAFEPLPDPFTGSESEGPNDIAFAPAGFPPALNNGIFVGFHGKWSLAGIANEENPVVFANLSNTNYFQFISNDEPNIGHIDGLLSTFDSLFLADFSSTGDPGNSVNSGVVYQIKSLVAYNLSCQINSSNLQFAWSRGGYLQQAASLSGPWNTIASGTNAFAVTVNTAQPQSFYRVHF